MNLLDPTATEKQHVERFKLLAFLKDLEGCQYVEAIVVNNILTDVELYRSKRSDFDDLESCVYSHLVEIGRGNVDLGQYFKSK